MNLRWEHLRVTDAGAWSELSETIAAADRHTWIVSAESAAGRLTAPGFDPALDSWAVWDGDKLVAYATSTVGSTPGLTEKPTRSSREEYTLIGAGLELEQS